MKKATSIILVFVILLAGFRAVVSTHICGGRIADQKVSLAGHLASCGMEGDEETCPLSGSQFDRHCCEDQINIAAVVNQFTMPQIQSEILIKKVVDFPYFQLTGLYPVSVSSTHSFTTFFPPGNSLTNSVSLEKMCVFRI